MFSFPGVPSLPFKNITILTVDNGWIVAFQDKEETESKNAENMDDEEDEYEEEGLADFQHVQPAWMPGGCFPAPPSPAKFKTFVFTNKTDLCQFLKEKL